MKVIIKLTKISGDNNLHYFCNFLFLYLREKEIQNNHFILIDNNGLKEKIVFKILKIENKEDCSIIKIVIDKKSFNIEEKSTFLIVFEEFLNSFIEKQQYNINLQLDYYEKTN